MSPSCTDRGTVIRESTTDQSDSYREKDETCSADEPRLRPDREVSDDRAGELVVQVEERPEDCEGGRADDRAGEDEAQPLTREQERHNGRHGHEEQPGPALSEQRQIDEESCGRERAASHEQGEGAAAREVEGRPHGRHPKCDAAVHVADRHP